MPRVLCGACREEGFGLGDPPGFTFKGKRWGFCLQCKLRLLQGSAFRGVLEEAETGAAAPGRISARAGLHGGKPLPLDSAF